MVIDVSKLDFRTVIGYFLCLSVLMTSANCMSSKSGELIKSHSDSKDQYAKKVIAVFSVIEMSDDWKKVSTDSMVPLKNGINVNIDKKFKELLPNSTIINIDKSTKILKQNKKLGLLGDMGQTYAATGDFDDNQISTLSKLLKCDFIVFSRMKIGKGDAIIVKATGAMLEVFMIDSRKNEITWGGAGNYKKGGIYGFGGTNSEEVAEELVNLTFKSF